MLYIHKDALLEGLACDAPGRSETVICSPVSRALARSPNSRKPRVASSAAAAGSPRTDALPLLPLPSMFDDACRSGWLLSQLQQLGRI